MGRDFFAGGGQKIFFGGGGSQIFAPPGGGVKNFFSGEGEPSPKICQGGGLLRTLFNNVEGGGVKKFSLFTCFSFFFNKNMKKNFPAAAAAAENFSGGGARKSIFDRAAARQSR